MHVQTHNKRKSTWAKLLVLLTFVLVSCKPTVPSEYIQPGEMEDLLYDYHVAMSMASVKGVSPTEQEAYKLAVFQRYGIDQTEFDNSLKYYTRHTERLKKMYEKIGDRLKKEAIAQGATASDFSQYGGTTLNGDTTNVWDKAKSMVLLPQSPYNYDYFEIKTDTAFHRGDLLTLEFDPLFIVQDGTREGVAVFTVTFKNDSVAIETARFFNDGHQVVAIVDDARLGIKRVRGFFYMPPPKEETTTFRLLAITNIKLIRMHQQKPPAVAPSDSVDNNYPIRNVGGEPVGKDQGQIPPNGGQPVIEKVRTPEEARIERGIPEPQLR